MTLCGGCGMLGTKENNWHPPEHKCPRWNTEYDALRQLASMVEAAFDPEGSGDVLDANHLLRAVAHWREIYERCKQVDYEKAIDDYTCTVCGKLDPTSPGKCQKHHDVEPGDMGKSSHLTDAQKKAGFDGK